MTSLRKTDIPWADYGYNPIVGCKNGCPYCFARNRIAPRLAHLCEKCGTFEPHLHDERVSQPYARQKPGVVFADPLSDWWSDGVEQEWRDEALIASANGAGFAPEHRFVVLTKRPERITEADTKWMRGNLWLGVSITSGADWWRWEALAKLKTNAHKFISVEPLLGPLDILAGEHRGDHLLRQSMPCSARVRGGADGQSERREEPAGETDAGTGRRNPCLSRGDLGRVAYETPEDNQPTGEAIRGSLRDGPGHHQGPNMELVIVGPQSGTGSRPVDPSWQAGIRNACAVLRIPLFEKVGLPILPAIRQMPPDLAAVYQKGGLT